MVNWIRHLSREREEIFNVKTYIYRYWKYEKGWGGSSVEKRLIILKHSCFFHSLTYVMYYSYLSRWLLKMKRMHNVSPTRWLNYIIISLSTPLLFKYRHSQTIFIAIIIVEINYTFLLIIIMMNLKNWQFKNISIE